MMIEEIEPSEAAQRLSQRPIVLVDVREQREVDHCKIEGAVHIPLGQMRQVGPERLNPDDEIILYCHHGGRSMMAAQILSGMGYEKLANLTGGIDAWSLEIDTDIPRY